MSDVWSAFADPSRRRILAMLRKGDMNAGDIASQFDMSKPSVSHHLSILKQAGLVDTEKQGQNVIYRLNTGVVEDMLAVLAKLAGEGEES